MNGRVDLHLHTTASDGCWTPEDLLEQVDRAGLGLFAVTDHESLGGLAETAQRVRGSGLRFLPGVELSARLPSPQGAQGIGQLLHLLAYGFDVADPVLNAFARENQARLLGASDEGIRLLAGAGYPIELDEYDAYSWDRRRGGWKALNFLIDRGLCHGVHDYFGRLWSDGLVHPQAEFPPPEAAIAAARRSGGVVVLAHPGAAFCSGLGEAGLDRLVEMGLQGLECYAYCHDQPTTLRYLDYCRSRGLLVTGGSDCHGGFAGRTLGVPAIEARDVELGPLWDRMVV